MRRRHSHYFLQWLAERERVGQNQRTTFESITLELDNARTACFWAVEHGLFDPFIQANTVLYLYYRWQGDLVTGNRLFRQLAEGMQSVTSTGGKHALAMMLTWRCAFKQLSTNYPDSKLLADETLALLSDTRLQAVDTRDIEAHIELWYGYNNYVKHPDKANLHFQRSYELSQKIDDPMGMAATLVGLGRVARNRNQPDEAEIHFRRAIQLHESIDNFLEYDDALRALGSLACRRQNFVEAEQLLNQALAHTPPNSRFAAAHTLMWLGQTYYLSGQFNQATVTNERKLARSREQGVVFQIAMAYVRLAAAYRELGDYQKARALVKTALSEFEALKMSDFVSMSLALLGSIDLLDGMIENAFDRLQQGVLNQPERFYVHFRWGDQAWLGIAARATGRRQEAWSHLLAELQRADSARLYMPLLLTFAGLALLMADDGEIERAVELIALIKEHPFIANAHWFDDLVGREVKAAAAATLSDDQRLRAEARGKARNLWETAQFLIATPASGW